MIYRRSEFHWVHCFSQHSNPTDDGICSLCMCHLCFEYLETTLSMSSELQADCGGSRESAGFSWKIGTVSTTDDENYLDGPKRRYY